VVIFGQPELEEKLNHPSIRQLKQRITFDYQLDLLSSDEMAYYLNHRLTIAGYKGSRMFSRTALYLMYYHSKGVPRLINILAHKALLATYGKGKHQVGMSEVLAAVTDTSSIQSTWRKIALKSLSLTMLFGIFGFILLIFINNPKLY
jgi:MSHA biogenesis protein MshM